MQVKSRKSKSIIGAAGAIDAEVNQLLSEGWELWAKMMQLPDGDFVQTMVLREVMTETQARKIQASGPPQTKPVTTTARVVGPPPQRTRPAFPAGSIGNGGRA
jgi:hypothetical protein